MSPPTQYLVRCYRLGLLSTEELHGHFIYLFRALRQEGGGWGT